MTELRPFHLAFQVTDLEQARTFYGDVLGCPLGRESDRWIDFDFFGHQITAHLVEQSSRVATNPVDGEKVPSRHFGMVLSMPQWQDLSNRLTEQGQTFLIPPTVRFAGKPSEQATLFITDPSGNALEFKAFANDQSMFATD